MNRVPCVQIIDYRLGNLFSIKNACAQAGIKAVVSSSREMLETVDGIILPGVGAFGQAMESLQQLGLADPLVETVANGKPLLGICLGMQLLFQESEEFGRHQGLGLLAGRIRKLPSQTIGNRKQRVPNVGWNQIHFTQNAGNTPISQGISDGTYMYFVHSLYADPADPADRLTETQYGEIRYCSSVQRSNILGTQFHPEKSGLLGLTMYRNWAQTLA